VLRFDALEGLDGECEVAFHCSEVRERCGGGSSQLTTPPGEAQLCYGHVLRTLGKILGGRACVLHEFCLEGKIKCLQPGLLVEETVSVSDAGETAASSMTGEAGPVGASGWDMVGGRRDSFASGRVLKGRKSDGERSEYVQIVR
jgi:hypothetical protein